MRSVPAGLIIENAVLRHRVNVLRCRRKRPKLSLVDRGQLAHGRRRHMEGGNV